MWNSCNTTELISSNVSDNGILPVQIYLTYKHNTKLRFMFERNNNIFIRHHCVQLGQTGWSVCSALRCEINKNAVWSGLSICLQFFSVYLRMFMFIT